MRIFLATAVLVLGCGGPISEQQQLVEALALAERCDTRYHECVEVYGVCVENLERLTDLSRSQQLAARWFEELRGYYWVEVSPQ